ncbi:MAG: hypothetical protein HON90_01805 [Halobacteriovoraceae bacterium]|jgi:tetratricopeptide (TPR) repeat protein|nr:hypothetical protein [Halobacteriovoraceae bacterium]
MKIFLSLSFFILVSCAGFNPVHIESNPSRAKVSMYDEEQKKFVEVGETPFILNQKKKEDIVKSQNSFIAFKVARPGFVIEHIIYDLKTKKKMTYLLQLKEIELWSDSSAEYSSKLANDIAKKVQKLNRYILAKQLSKALNIVSKLIEQYPKAYVFYDIKGSIHLLKGNTKQAITSFKSSLSINPDNIESAKVLKILERRRRK